jgi:chaperone modulatory protein CbpM
MYYDLSINMEGIDAIHHMLERMDDMRREITSLRKQLLLFREREIEEADW